MARPAKSKLDYFPIYCDHNESIEYLISRFGYEGYGIYISLLKRIYGEHGYYIIWNERSEYIFSNIGSIDTAKTKEIVNCLLDEGVFDREIYEKHSVLTSKEVQENYLYAVSKRKNISIDERFRLVNDEETGVNSAQTPINSAETTQRKEKKIIENNTIEEGENRKDNQVVLCSPSHTREKARGEFNNVILTESEYEELSRSYPDIDSSIERLSQYMAATGKSYASHFAVLKKWADEDCKNVERVNCSAAPPSKQDKNNETKTKAASPPRESSFDIDEFYALAVARSNDMILDDR